MNKRSASYFNPPSSFKNSSLCKLTCCTLCRMIKFWSNLLALFLIPSTALNAESRSSLWKLKSGTLTGTTQLCIFCLASQTLGLCFFPIVSSFCYIQGCSCMRALPHKHRVSAVLLGFLQLGSCNWRSNLRLMIMHVLLHRFLFSNGSLRDCLMDYWHPGYHPLDGFFCTFLWFRTWTKI